MNCASSVRIVNVDFYMNSPIQDLDLMYSDFRGSSIAQVPVIRIFGSADTGKKICLHVHGVFPYLYIPYDGSEDANSLKYQIAASIDKAINVSFGQASSTSQHVYKISLVSGIPLYGYHVREHQFFKIFLFNPALVRKVSNMLQHEIILGKLYQPHESHINFILQFMMDFNLHGMSKILLSELRYRTDEQPNSGNLFNDSIPKQSWCELEADALSEHILNRLEISKGNIAINPGIAALWEDEKQRLRDKNEDSQISPCLTLSNSEAAPTKSHLLFKRALLEKLTMSGDVAEKNDQNITVYPAETPSNKSMRNASYIDFHSPQSSDVGNDTMDTTTSFDDEAKDLFEVLQDLGENAEKGDVDSILSQVLNENEEDDDYFDLSMSLAETTPFKNIVNENDDDSDELDRTLVPQLDGQHDSDSGSDECDQKNRKTTQKAKNSSKYGALPIFVSSPAISSEKPDLQPKEKPFDIYGNVKRILNFPNSAIPDITICEDSLECEFKPQRSEKISKVEHCHKKEKTADHNFSNTKIEEISSSESGKEEISNSKIDHNEKDSSLESDIFLETKNSDMTTNPKIEFTVAQLYDMRTNFKAKEGSSTKLTQCSETGDVKLSSESNSDHLGKPSEKSSQSEISPNSWYYNGLNDSSGDLSHKNNEMYEYLPMQKNIISESTSILITPQCKPPTKSDVFESLDNLNIPTVSHEIPYYGNVEDVTGTVEIGYSVLKIHSKTTAHLEDFKSCNDALDTHRKTQMPENPWILHDYTS